MCVFQQSLVSRVEMAGGCSYTEPRTPLSGDSSVAAGRRPPPLRKQVSTEVDSHVMLEINLG